ncbi:MAG: hypothetical protein GY745_11180 [Actinomycetia bacterium]|nr:hypothetical protein [Actinomycetes bacterium]
MTGTMERSSLVRPVTAVAAALAIMMAGCGSSAPSPSRSAAFESIPATIVTGAGQPIEIDGGGAFLGPLVEWGLGRFTEAGLEEPHVPRVQFKPDDPACIGVTGLFRDNEQGRSIVICLDEDRICEFPDVPDRFRATARSCILHELAHAWITDSLDQEARETFTAVSPVENWYEKGGTWNQQGIEHAAEIISWGLIDEHLPLNRLDNPQCTDVETRFRLLTGVEPLIPCEERP